MDTPGPSRHADHQSILNSITDGVLTVDRGMIITSFNRAAEKITQVRRTEAIGHHCFEVMRAEVCESGCPIKKTFKTGNPCKNVPIYIVRADKKRIPISVTTGIVRDDQGNVIGGVETFRDLSELKKLRREIYKKHSFEDIVSKNHKMLQLFSILPQVAGSHSTVLIEGASGTGKELFARAIHNHSSRSQEKYTPVNCSAIPENLLEGILFGTSKGAFTGAVNKAGLLERTTKGTIFLDEINSMPVGLQSKILRNIQESRVRRVGDLREIEIDLKIISSVNRDPHIAIADGTLRSDFLSSGGGVYPHLTSVGTTERSRTAGESFYRKT